MSEIKAITRNREGKCKHFNGVMNETCDAGVKYAEVQKDNEPPAKGRSLPCLTKYNTAGATCDKCELPTPEEVEAGKKAMQKRIDDIGNARAAIVAHLGGPWRRGKPAARGSIDCPCCGKAGALRFSRSGYNGHIHARCDTPGCCSWME